MALVNTGLLLIYRLNEFGMLLPTLSVMMTFNIRVETHSAQVNFIKSLPQDPLIAMYLAVNHATLTARYHGEGVINQRTYGMCPLTRTASLLSRVPLASRFTNTATSTLLHHTLIPLWLNWTDPEFCV